MTTLYGLALGGALSRGLPDARDLIEQAEYAETLGYHSIWAPDHVMMRGPVTECVTLLGAFAGATRRLQDRARGHAPRALLSVQRRRHRAAPSSPPSCLDRRTVRGCREARRPVRKRMARLSREPAPSRGGAGEDSRACGAAAPRRTRADRRPDVRTAVAPPGHRPNARRPCSYSWPPGRTSS